MTDYDNFLADWYASSRAYQVEKLGHTFDLTLPQFHGLISANQRATIRRHLREGTIDGFMASNFGYVLSWTSKAAGLGGVMNKTTAKVQPRDHSKKMFRIQKGEKQTARAKAKIGDAKRGKRQSEEHVQARAEAQRGVTRGPMSQAHKDAISAGRRLKLTFGGK